MRKGSQLTVKIEKIKFPSTGVGTHEGKEVHVKNTFPGQIVTGMIKKNRSEFSELKLISIDEKAEYEIDAPCEYFGVCGGCSSQNIAYEKQLDLLSEEVKELFETSNTPMGEYLGVVGSREQWEYRNKMEFTFGDMEKGGEIGCGMHMKGKSFGIITVENCMLIDEDFRTVIKETVNYFKDKGLDYYRVMKRTGFLRHLVIRKATNTGELMINLVTTTQSDFDLTEWVEVMKSKKYKGELVSVLHTENDSLSDAVIPQKLNIMYGRDYIIESLLGLKFKISPFSFFQTNSRGAESLYSIVRDFMGDAKDNVVFDLYCGTGTIGQIAAANASKVIGLELVEEAVESAKENAKLNGLTNCEFIAGDVAVTIKDIKIKPDIIILDPPRNGVHPKALEYVIKFNAKEIIYVSCNPKTLVENLETLTARGYEVVRSTVKDMFPNTPHAEVVVKLKRK